MICLSLRLLLAKLAKRSHASVLLGLLFLLLRTHIGLQRRRLLLWGLRSGRLLLGLLVKVSKRPRCWLWLSC